MRSGMVKGAKALGMVLMMLAFLTTGRQGTGWADDQDTQSIEERLRSLEQEMADLKRQLEAKKEAGGPAKTEEAKKTTDDAVVVTASVKDGFSIKSADDSFKMKLRGVLQTDGRYFVDGIKGSTTSTFSVRRARIIFEGTVGKIFDFFIMPDFGGGASTLIDAYGEFKLASAFKIRGGKFKSPMGLERLQSDTVNNFTEAGLPSNLLPARDVGFQLSGDVLGDSVNYAVGVFNGATDSASATSQDTDNDSDKDVVARVFAHLFKNHGPEVLKGLGIGVAGSYGHREGATTPSYKSAGQATIFSYTSTTADGAHIRVTPQAYFYKGPLGMMAEYAVSQMRVARVSGSTIIRDTVANDAWQVTGNYILTGEKASFKGITPNAKFDLSQGTWGAFEVVGRYGQLDIDDKIFGNGFASLSTAVTDADEWGVGLNWYPHKAVRLSLDFVQTQFEGGAVGGGDRKTENAILSRFLLVY